MIKVIKKLKVFLLISCVNMHSFAGNNGLVNSATNHNVSNYDTGYHKNEGNVILKLKAGSIKSSNNLIENGYSIGNSTLIFFTNNVAAELSLGFSILRTKNISLKNTTYNYGIDPASVKKKNVYMIPMTITGLYQIAPFDSVRPYVGVGYHGSYIFNNKDKGFLVKNGHGTVLQAGIDLYIKDNTLINIDIKQYFLNSKVSYNNVLIKRISAVVKFNPLMITMGIGFKF